MPDGANKGSFIQAYNAQAAVDGHAQIMVAADITPQANDRQQLVPMIAQVQANVGRVPDAVSADAGYWSAANVADPGVAGIDLPIATGRQPHGDPTGPIDEPLAEPASAKEAMRHKLRTAAGILCVRGSVLLGERAGPCWAGQIDRAAVDDNLEPEGRVSAEIGNGLDQDAVRQHAVQRYDERKVRRPVDRASRRVEVLKPLSPRVDQPSRQIQRVDAQGEERAAALAFPARPILAAGQPLDSQPVCATDLPRRFHASLERSERRIPAQSIPYVDRRAGHWQRACERFQLIGGNAERLFHKYWCSCGDRLQAEPGVKVIRHRDRDRVHVWQHALERVEPRQFRRCRPCRDDAHNGGAAGYEMAEMIVRDLTETHQADPQRCAHVHPYSPPVPRLF
jgi:hypothetical protein